MTDIFLLFYRKTPETNLSKYSQYIAIPVICSRNKYLGVLQITTKQFKRSNYNGQKYRNEITLVDLSEKRNLKIEKSTKSTISDEYIKDLEDNIESHFLQFQEFNQYVIEQDLKNKPQI